MTNLQALREAKNLSRLDLSKKAMLTERCIHQIETGTTTTIRQRSRVKLAKALRCAVADLFDAQGKAKEATI